jgi:aconitate hydratase
VALAEAYARRPGHVAQARTPDPEFTDVLELDLRTVEPALAGPKRPQDRVAMRDLRKAFDETLELQGRTGAEADRRVPSRARTTIWATATW